MNDDYQPDPWAVDEAVKWLDEISPEWYYHIDEDTLNIDDPARCVLGQHPRFDGELGRVNGNYNFNTAYLHELDPEREKRCNDAFLFDEIRDDWIEAIKERKDADLDVLNRRLDRNRMLEVTVA